MVERQGGGGGGGGGGNVTGHGPVMNPLWKGGVLKGRKKKGRKEEGVRGEEENNHKRVLGQFF